MVVCVWWNMMWPYVIGFVFSVVAGGIFIWYATGALWKSVGRKRDRSDSKLHADPELPAQVGIVERSLYTASILAEQEQFIAVWLGLKAISSWSIWNKLKDAKGQANGAISGRSVFNIYLIGNGLSVAYGVVGGWITKCLLAQPWQPMRAVALASGPLILTALIWSRATCVCSMRKRESKRP